MLGENLRGNLLFVQRLFETVLGQLGKWKSGWMVDETSDCGDRRTDREGVPHSAEHPRPEKRRFSGQVIRAAREAPSSSTRRDVLLRE